MSFTHASYTAAWICALPVELAAAKVFLDEVHPRLTQPESDHNVYTLGCVSGHNVVVACLPAGVYGTTSATAAISHLKSTYHNIRFGLMVGVGGGVPKRTPDIRLGDIVVSKPTNISSGVIQYDYGKTLQNGRFHRTGSLNKPPSLLLKVIAQMESDSILGKGLLSKVMASYLQKEEVRGQFPRPSKDLLFHSTYDHSSDNPTCSTCDPSQQMDRPERKAKEPQIHYGLVASANQVMKDARVRDQITQELDILCFEMEAAGLMDEIPSLVIRGICDYCDSHKHKEWQPYAAFVAAAYAKAVLIQVPIQERADNLGKSRPEKRHWTVPFRKNPGFVGREGEIAKVEELFENLNGPFKVALCGLGGVGKTQIALEVAYRVRERDPTCSVFWIPCTSNATVEQAFMGIAQTIGLQGVRPPDAKERVKVHLSRVSSQKWLLIFDNADDMDMWVGNSAGAIDLANFLLPSEQGHILFTTRNRKLAVRLASHFVIDISEPDTGTGVKILEEALKKKELLEDEGETIALLEQLTFLPLAISQAAAYINSNGIKLSDYTSLLKEQESDIIELLSEDFGDDGRYQDVQNPVSTTWLVSFQQVQRLNPLAAEYLSFMACINPRDVPQSLLPEAPSKKRKIDAIGLLKAFSFVSEQVGNRTLSLHRLVHLSTRNWLRREQQLGLQIQKTANHLNQIFPDNDYKNQMLWREYLPHALLLMGESHFQKERELYKKLIQSVGRCLRTDGRYHEAAVLFADIVGLQKAEGGDNDDPCTMASMADLALTYIYQGRWKEAEELGVQVMEVRGRVLGPEHPDTLASMANLASTYRDQGRWKEAEELGLQVMEVRGRVLGSEHPDTLTSMANLASTYWNQGRWKEAEELVVQVIEVRGRVLGPEHPDTLASMANLASTYRNQGRWKEAEELDMQVMEAHGRVLGPEHPDTLTSMANLASTYWNQGRWKEAEELDMQVMEVHGRVLGPEHPDTLTSMANLASTYFNQGRWKEAEELDVQVIEVRGRVLGSEHPDTLTSMANLASTYRNQGRWKEAEELDAQVMEVRGRVLGPEHPDTLASMANLAHTFYSQENIYKALVLMEDCVKLRGKLLGHSHPHTRNSARSLKRWKKKAKSSTNQQHAPNPPHGAARPTAPLRAFLENHPFLLAARAGSSRMREHDLHEVD
jgi:nucleoside phosphorylase/tetratricopeptide (TPR) repeat protein